VRIAGVDLIEAVKYARNVDQHVFHIVEPGETDALIGGLHGYRSYVVWDEVPLTAHNDLHRSTQALKPHYDAELKGKDVTEAMIGVLRFYGSLDPAIIHRDDRGEWTGFPLADQPGVASPLHPEEPLDEAAAAAWLDARQPNGDARVVCAQVTLEDVRYLCGFTFADQRSFSPFAETAEQIERDVAAGMPYLIGDVTANTENAQHLYPRAQGGVYFSPTDVMLWAAPTVAVERETDWQTWGEAETWRQVVRTEHGTSARLLGGHLIRRARRLNAYTPPGA
jgi:hypothetical protein